MSGEVHPKIVERCVADGAWDRLDGLKQVAITEISRRLATFESPFRDTYEMVRCDTVEFFRYCVTALTRKNLFVEVLPYIPGSEGVQLIRSELDSKMICTGPVASLGITTAVDGRFVTTEDAGWV